MAQLSTKITTESILNIKPKRSQVGASAQDGNLYADDGKPILKLKGVFVMSNTVKLQGIHGQQPAIPTKELKVGDFVIWNYGYKSEVVEIIPSKTGKTITFMLKSLESGNVSARKMGADRLVVVERKQEKPTHPIDKAIKERKTTHNGIYSDIGNALDKFSTEELAKYYIEKFGDGGLRYFLEQQITASEINKLKAV